MKEEYPKKPREIFIVVTRRELEDGLLTSEKNVTEQSLHDKMDDYILRLGYSNASVWAIILQLLTKSKVQVDFRDYNERLTLKNEADRLTSPQAVSLLEDYFAQSKGTDKFVKDDVTRKFIAQSPKTNRFRK